MRFFYKENISSGSMELSAETAKHVVQVLRMKVGDQFLLTNGKGLKATAEIELIQKRSCTITIIEQEEIENKNPDISLAIAFTKNNSRMEWLLEKITEIGVRNIYPIKTSRSEKSKLKIDRFHKKIVSAMLQSQQYHLPVLHQEIAFNDLASKEFALKLIAHCENDLERNKINHFQLSTFNSQLIVIGPEGDFTTDEIELALQQNFKSVSLGNNRLRTETAGLVAVTLLHHNAQ